MHRSWASLAFAAWLLAPGSCPAAHFKWAAAGDHVTADPHAQDAQLTNSINLHVYEPLLMRIWPRPTRSRHARCSAPGAWPKPR